MCISIKKKKSKIHCPSETFPMVFVHWQAASEFNLRVPVTLRDFLQF